MQELNQPTPSLFISGSTARAALAGLAGYRIPIAVLCNTSLCWQGAGASIPAVCRAQGGSSDIPGACGLLALPWLWQHCRCHKSPGNIQPAAGKARNKRLLQVPKAQPGVEGHSSSSPKHRYLGLAVQQCRSPGNGARARGIKEQKVAASESRQKHPVTEVKTSLPDPVGWLLPGEARDFLPTSHPKG